MKRILTAEQIQRRDERRAKMRSLASQISKMTEAQRAELAANCPVVTIEGRALSIFNQCFLATRFILGTVFDVSQTEEIETAVAV